MTTPDTTTPSAPVPAGAPTPPAASPPRPIWRSGAFLTGLALLCVAALGFSGAVAHYGIMLKKLPIYPSDGRLLNTIPSTTASWQRIGADRRENPEVENTLGTANYISRSYEERSPKDGTPIRLDFHAAYYTGMIDTVPHVPDRCFVGGGLAIGKILGDMPLPLSQSDWRLDETVPEAMRGRIFTARSHQGDYPRLPRDPGQIQLRTMRFLDKQGNAFYAGYFFIANGGTVSRAEGVRLLAFDLKSTYAYYMKVQFTSLSPMTDEEFVQASARLLDELFPDLMLCTPDWVDVERGVYPPAGQ
jgi:hypothetical protein